MTTQSKNKSLDQTFKESFEELGKYFKSLNKIEIIAWSLIGAGLVLLILGFVFI